MKTVKLFFEAGELKRVKRSGWWAAGVKDPETVAEHSWRASLVAFVLARMEKMDAEKIAVAAIFHDLPEARLLDRHKISTNYLKTPKEVEERIYGEQLALLPREAWPEKLNEAEKILLKDADLLECALQAREYEEIGYSAARDWLVRIGKKVRTKNARKLFKELLKEKPTNWWAGLKQSIYGL